MAAHPWLQRPLAWLDRSIVRRVSLGAFLLTLLFALVVGLASYAVTREVLRNLVAERLRAEAATQARQVEEPLSALARELSALAQSGFLTNALVDTVGRERYVAPFLREYRFSPPVPVMVSLCDHRGRVLEANRAPRPPGYESAPWLAWLLNDGRPHAGLEVRGGRGRLLLAYPVVLAATGSVEGVLVAEFDLAAAFAARPRPPDPVRLRLLDGGGRVLAADEGWADMSSVLRPLSWQGVDRALLPGLGLQIETGIPRNLALGDLRWLAVVYGAAGLLLIGAALAAARLLAGKLTRPVRALNDATREAAARASFDVCVAAPGSDEIAQLGATFNHLLERLRHATEERYALEQARRAEAEGALELAHQALEQFADGVIILSAGGTVLYSNEIAARLRGLPRERVIGSRIWEMPGTTVAAPPSEAAWSATFSELRRAGSLGRTARYAAAGREGMADIRMAHVSFGGREYAVVTFRDAGERLHAEQASRMASLGSLAAGVAHEINNPLAFVAANLDHAAAELRCRTGADGSIAVEPAAAKELAEALADASEGARRVKEVVRSLHVFSRPSEGQAAPVSVEAELRAALSLADNEIRHRARVEARIDPVPPVVAGAHELGQVFLNLLVNAAQAIPEGHRQENAIRIECRRAADGQVLVEIADSGVGISPDRLPRIFEPFYTTKPGSGTGLGLSICHGVVTRLGGRIAVDSQAGRGSTFRVFLPPAPAAAEPAEAAAVTPDPLPGRLRLLVVDDEESVGRALGRILGGRHQVAAVTSAREALERIERGEQFDGVVCDLMMPEMSGIDLHRALTRSAPRLAERMVLMTGGAFTPAAQEFLSESHIPCVEKPFEADALLEALARAVAR